MPKVGPPLPGAAAEECGQPGRGWGCRGGALVDQPCTPFLLCHTPLPSRAAFCHWHSGLWDRMRVSGGAGDKWGPMETQPQLLTMPVNNSVLIDLNLLGATPNAPHPGHGAAEHLLR